MRKAPRISSATNAGPPLRKWSVGVISSIITLGGFGVALCAGLVGMASRPVASHGLSIPPAPGPGAAGVVVVGSQRALSAPSAEECPAEVMMWPALSRSDPAAAVIAALEAGDYAAAAVRAAALSDSEDRLQCLLPIVAGWVEAQPAKAARFAGSLPAGRERAEVLAVVAGGWFARDVISAGTWLDQSAVEEDHDRALAVAATLSRGQPEAALYWAGRITDASSRWEATRVIVQDWAVADESAARIRAGQIPGLTGEQRNQLLKRIGQRTALLD
jgi:hypothetical protein